jgi:hypothetical protein
LGRVQNQ